MRNLIAMVAVLSASIGTLSANDSFDSLHSMWSDRMRYIQDVLAKHVTTIAGELKRVRINLTDDHDVRGVIAYKSNDDDSDTVDMSMGFITMVHFIVMADECLNGSQVIAYVKYYADATRKQKLSPGNPILDPIDWAGWSQAERDCFEQDEQKMEELTKLENGTVAFVLAHELGHHVLGHSASPTTDPQERLKREVAADKFACDTMVASDVGPLVGAFALLYYAAVDGDSTAHQENRDHPMSVFRVEALIDSEMTNLDHLTIQSGTSKAAVRTMFEQMSEAVKKGIASGDLAFVSAADPWSRGGTVPGAFDLFQNDSAISDAIDLEDNQSIDWHTSLSQPTVDYKLIYKNDGDVPIECLIQVAVGAVPRAKQSGSSWQEVSKNTHHFALNPGQEITVKGTLWWMADATHMPRIEYPDPSVDLRPEYYKCRSK